MAEVRGSDFYRQRADDMRRQADRALNPHLRETYLRIALDWERMADDVQAKESKCGSADETGSNGFNPPADGGPVRQIRRANSE